jgi:hypothetical protein
VFVDGSRIGVGARSECDETVNSVEAASSVEIRGGGPDSEPEGRGDTSGSCAFFLLKTLDSLLLIDPKVEVQSTSLGGAR